MSYAHPLEGIMSDGQKDDLERLVDHYGFDQILDALADIASKRASFFEDMWQDSNTALHWSRVASAISVAAEKSVGLW